MDPIIYRLSKPDKNIKDLDFYFENDPSPKLVKYGFSMTDELDLVGLTSNPYYKAGLNFDLDRTDENSLAAKASQALGAKGFSQGFAELWEVLNLFGFLGKKQHVSSTEKDTVQDVFDVYKKYTGSKAKWTFAAVKDKKADVTLVVHRYSDVDIDENAAIQFIVDDLPRLLGIQAKNAAMVLQLFGLQTQTSAEIIYYLASLYNEAYLVRPAVASDLSDLKYLVLIGLNTKPKLVIPKHPKDAYLHSIGLRNLPNNFTTVIQCANSEIIPRKFQKYGQIKSYLDTKVYEGATYQEFMVVQNANVDRWLEIYGNLDDIGKVTDAALEKTDTRCSSFGKMMEMLA